MKPRMMLTAIMMKTGMFSTVGSMWLMMTPGTSPSMASDARSISNGFTGSLLRSVRPRSCT